MTQQNMSDRDALKLLDDLCAQQQAKRDVHALFQTATMKMAVLVAAEERRQEERAKFTTGASEATKP